MAALSGDGPRRATNRRVAIAMLTPLAGVTIAYALWSISDRLLYIGQLDRAKFGWLVVVPVWSLTPVAAAYVWQALNRRQSGAAAAVVGLTLAVAATALVWLATAFPDCQFGAVRTPADLVLPSVLVGVVIGGGFAGICLASAALLRRGRRWSALFAGAGSAFALVFVAVLVYASVFMPPAVCNRPPLG